MSAVTNKQLLEQIYLDAADRSGTTFADNITDDVCWVVTGQYSWSGTFRGRDAVLNDLHGYVRSRLGERVRTVAHRFIAEGDYVVVESRGENVSKDGLRYDNDYCMVFRLENGKIKEVRDYCDSALVERVLGEFPASRVPAAG